MKIKSYTGGKQRTRQIIYFQYIRFAGKENFNYFVMCKNYRSNIWFINE